MPLNAITPLRWDSISVWLREPGEEDQEFEQRTHIVLPDGKEIAEATQLFKMTDKKAVNIGVTSGFPIGQAGMCSIVLSYRRVSPENRWEVVAEYPVEVAYQDGPVEPVMPIMIKS